VPDAAELVRRSPAGAGPALAPRGNRQPTGSQRVRSRTDVIARACRLPNAADLSLAADGEKCHQQTRVQPHAIQPPWSHLLLAQEAKLRHGQWPAVGQGGGAGVRSIKRAPALAWDRGCPLCVHAALADCRGGDGPRACGWLTAKRPSGFRRRCNDICNDIDAERSAPLRGDSGAPERTGTARRRGRVGDVSAPHCHCNNALS
jgi:hypothetical protein